jgi:hypothetical protein
MPNRLQDALVKVWCKAKESLGQSQTGNDRN